MQKNKPPMQIMIYFKLTSYPFLINIIYIKLIFILMQQNIKITLLFKKTTYIFVFKGFKKYDYF